MSQGNMEVVTRIYTGWEQGDFAVGVSLFDRNVTLVIDPEIPDAGVYIGEEGVRTYMTRFLDAWDSLTIAAESFTDVGDTVLVKVQQTGIGSGSGAPVNASYFQLWTFRGGKVVRLETVQDEAEALEAVGLRD